ncbi:NADPH:quinone oxidoreductase family protein [Aeromicrobium alkaliterrae]|uniref:NADPH:quinone oxidoreductase family protein n=1 Tax=Aeromicrobium alkaliterrae TaxID=302168 RepID=A0ABN2K886_9ACTN
MKALRLTSLTGPSALELVDVDEPVGADLVHIRVGAAGVNYPDLLLMRGEYQGRVEPPFVPGSEVAGTVVSAPAGSGWSAGDRVMALPGIGGYAERVAVAPGLVLRTPDVLHDTEAVALLANHQTAYFSLVVRARLEPRETVVVLGAAGGVGTAAIQVASALGARVIGVVHREGADDFVREVGADEVVPLRDGWAAQVRELTGGRGADIVIDPVGGDAFDDAVRCLAHDGRLVVVGFAGGGIPSVKVNRLLLRNVGVLGAGWGEALRADPTLLAVVAGGVDDLVVGGLRPAVTQRAPLADGASAVEQLAAGGVLGKIVLEP